MLKRSATIDWRTRKEEKDSLRTRRSREKSSMQRDDIALEFLLQLQAPKWPEGRDVARNTFPVFLQPNYDVILRLPTGITKEVPHKRPD
jgi:hypothetical protein